MIAGCQPQKQTKNGAEVESHAPYPGIHRVFFVRYKTKVSFDKFFRKK
jgi:hypothetical protein